MDTYIHTILRQDALLPHTMREIRFRKNMIEDIVSTMLETLEKEGFIATAIDKDGDKELIPVSELIAKALRESKKMTKKVKNA